MERRGLGTGGADGTPVSPGRPTTGHHHVHALGLFSEVAETTDAEVKAACLGIGTRFPTCGQSRPTFCKRPVCLSSTEGSRGGGWGGGRRESAATVFLFCVWHSCVFVRFLLFFFFVALSHTGMERLLPVPSKHNYVLCLRQSDTDR